MFSPVVVDYHIAVWGLVAELAPFQTRCDPHRPPRVRTAGKKKME